MSLLAVWYDLDADHGVLKLDEAFTAPGPPLELYVMVDADTDQTIAWWISDEGAWLGAPVVGRG